MIGPFVVLAALALSAGTVMVVVLAITGRRDPTQPRCASCRSLLDAGGLIDGSPCAHCRADLGGAKAIRPRWRAAGRSVWISLAALVLLWPAGIGLGAYLNALDRKKRVFMPAVAAPAVLVATALRETPQSFGAGESIRTLLTSGDLPIAEFRALLLAEMRSSTPAAAAPDRGSTQRVVGWSLQRRPNDEELLDAMLDFLEPAPTATATLSAPTGRDARRHMLVALSSGPAFAHDSYSVESIDTELVLRRITVDGKEIPIRMVQQSRGSPCALCMIVKNADSFMLEPLAPGTHTIELDLTADAYDSFDGLRLLHMNHCVPIGAEPPKPLRSKPRPVSFTVRIDAQGQPIQPPSSAPVGAPTADENGAPASGADTAPGAP